MKILESQSAVLSNYEVLEHLNDQRKRYKQARRRGGGNLENVVKEVMKGLQTYPNPLSQKPPKYTDASIAALMERLRPYKLSKGEMLMLLNVRPPSIAALNSIIEDMSVRFTEDEQWEMLAGITEVLGQFEGPPPRNVDPQADGGDSGETADVTMDEAAPTAS